MVSHKQFVENISKQVSKFYFAVKTKDPNRYKKLNNQTIKN